MMLASPTAEIEYITPNACELIERVARTCYRSEGRIKAGSAQALVRKLIRLGHDSMLEHAHATVRFVCDRGISHELVRHRLAAFAQESTRYVRYGDRVEASFVRPDLGGDADALWRSSVADADCTYDALLEQGVTAEIARSVLPTALRTELCVTANFREWIHILTLRTADSAHPQMREIMVPLGLEFAARYPEIFGQFGPPIEADVDAVADWLRACGIRPAVSVHDGTLYIDTQGDISPRAIARAKVRLRHLPVVIRIGWGLR